MPNVIDGNGLQIKSLSEITSDLIAAYQSIYGADINVGPNSPDGQLIGIIAQNVRDLLELLMQINSSFSIDGVFGVLLDQRAALSGIQRKSGTYTLAMVSVTANQALSLKGAGPDPVNPIAGAFTVSDNAGNQFQLIADYAFSGAGTTSLAFRSAVIGQVQTVQNTIQIVITSQLGVTAVNNPTTSGDTEGLPEETDPQLKIRRAASFYLQSVGPADSIRAALLAIADITDAYVVENDTGSTDGDGVPAHSIWVIVNGGSASEIGLAIYTKKAPGCGMFGAQTFNVARPQGGSFVAKWDNAISQNLYVRATLNPSIPGQVFDLTTDAAELAAALLYKLGQSPNIGDVVKAMAAIEPNAILSTVNVSSDGVTWEDIVTPSDPQHYFVLLAGNITLS